LHGNSLLKETSPHQDSDQNVFDIQQGVSILIAVKEKFQKQQNNFSAKVFCSNLWGDRKTKYAFLATASVDSIEWVECNPVKPNYFFTVADLSFETEYFKSWSIKDIFTYSSTGIETGKDSALVNFSVQSLETTLSDLYDPSVSLDQLKERYEIEETSGWTVSKKRSDLTKGCFDPSKIQEYNYRPFDNRYIHFDNFLRRPHRELMAHLLQPNLTLMASRQQTEIGFHHIFITNKISDCNALSLSSRERNYYFPIYLYPDFNSDQGSLFVEKSSNLSLSFIAAIQEKLGYIPTPEAIFHYIYAVFHSPTYRQRYAEFLKNRLSPRTPYQQRPALQRPRRKRSGISRTAPNEI
jgi:predicted helicase